MVPKRILILAFALPLLIVSTGGAQPPEQSSEVPEPTILGPSALDLAASDPAERFVAANKAYDEGQYAEAIDAYSQVVAAGIEDGRLYYNLGNAYLRNGELGRALSSYRRGRIVRPRDQDLLANQSFARGSAQDAIEPPGPSALVSTLLFWYYALSPSELALLLLGVNLLFWAVAVARIFRPVSEALRWCSMLIFVLLISTGGSLLARRWLSPPVAVVLPQEIDAFTGPNLDSVVRFKLHAGTELRVRERREDWIRVTLPNGQQGWAQSQWIDVVD